MNLSTYTDLINNSIVSTDLDSVSSVVDILPENLRVTIVDDIGNVLFDNTIDANISSALENHFTRPEISNARVKGVGSAVRYSDTKKIDYYYYAKDFGSYFVRVALPDDIYLKESLKADKYFLYFIIILFFVALIIISYISDKLGRAISGLKEFLFSVESNNPEFDKICFPDTEIGDIGHKIVQTYMLLECRNRELDQEREKLLRHFQYLKEGIAIYSSSREATYANAHFIQHLNTIKDDATFNADDVFAMEEFAPMVQFLEHKLPLEYQYNELPVWHGKIEKSGHHFAVRLIIFQDSTFELTLSNISAQENNKILKHEMTNNIAHELRTPVSSISGYLETIITQEGMDEGRKKLYLERAYSQVKRLSYLIRDIALITKTESAHSLFVREEVNMANMLEEIKIDLDSKIVDAKATFEYTIAEDVTIVGNHTLLYAIFSNLIDNSLNYGGENVNISVDNYAEDESFYYFKFSNSGHAIPSEHITRVFDRFYRIDQGRSRATGGSGLGLSIVKNAVIFHKGEITAKSSIDSGVEFLFSLCKKV